MFTAARRRRLYVVYPLCPPTCFSFLFDSCQVVLTIVFITQPPATKETAFPVPVPITISAMAAALVPPAPCTLPFPLRGQQRRLATLLFLEQTFPIPRLALQSMRVLFGFRGGRSGGQLLAMAALGASGGAVPGGIGFVGVFGSITAGSFAFSFVVAVVVAVRLFVAITVTAALAVPLTISITIPVSVPVPVPVSLPVTIPISVPLTVSLTVAFTLPLTLAFSVIIVAVGFGL